MSESILVTVDMTVPMTVDMGSNIVQQDLVQYDNNWDDDERSIRMVNYKIVNKNEDTFIPINKILKELYEEDRELQYCRDDEYYSMKSYSFYSDIESEYEEESDYSVYDSDLEQCGVDSNDEKETSCDFIDNNKFCYI